MIIIFIVIALITMISIVITIMFGTTATTMSSITTSFWGSQDRSVLLALLFNPRVAMTHANEIPHRRRRRFERTNEIKKTHLLNLLRYAVCNMATLHAEEGRTTLRDIASALHCSNAGVRLRYEADYGTDGVVGAFQELTAWNDLLTAEQRSRGSAATSLPRQAALDASRAPTSIAAYNCGRRIPRDAGLPRIASHSSCA